MRRATLRFVPTLACIAAISGCAAVRITSDPPGADVVCSPTGTPPWLPWPPQESRPLTTPVRKWIRPDPYYFVRANKDGYFPAPPQFMDVGPWRRQHLHFRLEPTLELFARQQRERGLVLYSGQWLNPKEHDLVEYQGKWMPTAEKFKREQQAKGLVFHDGLSRWMTPKEKEAIEAEEKRAKGLVEFKGQWLTPLEADLQQLIDRQTERIAASTVTYELRVELIGPVFTSGSELRVTDLSGHLLEVLASGPQSRRSQVPPYNTATIQCLPGTYTLVVMQADAHRTGQVGIGRIRLAAKSRYSATYRGGPQTTRIPLVLPATSELRTEPPGAKAPPPPVVAPPPTMLPPLQPRDSDQGTSKPVGKPPTGSGAAP